MADTAYQNAMKRRDDVAAKIAQLEQDVIEFRRELGQIDAFLSAWRKFAGVSEDTEARLTLFDTEAGDGKRERPDNPSREEVVKHVRDLIRARGEPIARNTLLKALEVDGVQIRGKDPNMILSTMLWRSKDDVVRLRGHGYWLKEEPYPAANYDPSKPHLNSPDM